MDVQPLIQQYRDAFGRYTSTVRRIQHMVAWPVSNTAEVDAAVLDMETARAAYVRARNALAAHMQPALAVSGGLSGSWQNSEAHVRETARLLWEAGGRRDGTAAGDWMRAEQIVGRASATLH